MGESASNQGKAFQLLGALKRLLSLALRGHSSMMLESWRRASIVAASSPSKASKS